MYIFYRHFSFNDIKVQAQSAQPLINKNPVELLQA